MYVNISVAKDGKNVIQGKFVFGDDADREGSAGDVMCDKDKDRGIFEVEVLPAFKISDSSEITFEDVILQDESDQFSVKRETAIEWYYQ